MLLFSLTALAAAQAVHGTAAKKAIVVTSFGTTFDEARAANIDSVENAIKAGFPDYDVRRAFTSKIVMKRLAERGIIIDSLEEALAKLKKEGYREVVVQTTLLTPGEEYDNKVMAVVNKHLQAKSFDKLVVGRPLLTYQGENGTTDDFLVMANALKQQMPVLQLPDRAVVFMGHGSPNRHNPAYGLLQAKLTEIGLNAVVGVVEETDHPNFADALKMLEEKGYKKVVLMPLMLVAGDHANNDMAGDEDDSWKNLLKKEGYQVQTYLHGLGENTAVQEIYVQHVRDAILGR
ncbi:MAG: sirohydrochlorin cobaltochelatase [Negativicutes bacterium]|nr:sirohydrochlorin cobaltochelatase [Negativicutes bacterium]